MQWDQILSRLRCGTTLDNIAFSDVLSHTDLISTQICSTSTTVEGNDEDYKDDLEEDYYRPASAIWTCWFEDLNHSLRNVFWISELRTSEIWRRSWKYCQGLVPSIPKTVQDTCRLALAAATLTSVFSQCFCSVSWTVLKQVTS